MSVLPREMDEIRKREEVMLKKERLGEEKKQTETSQIAVKRDSITIDAKKGLDIHVPMSSGVDFTKLQGLINIHVHFHEK